MNRKALQSPPVVALLLLAVIGLPVGIAVLSLGSGADFGDSERFAGNRLGAGSVEIDLGGLRDGGGDLVAGLGQSATPSDPTIFSASDMAPGDEVSGVLSIDNSGTLPIRLWVTASATTSSGPLGDWLLFDGWVAADCSAGPGDEAVTQSFGTKVVLGTQPVPLIGEPEQVDESLVIDPGQNSTVCVGAHLPLAAPNEVQAASVDVELIVHAEHRPEES